MCLPPQRTHLQELETPQQRAARERSYAAALAAYKAKAGLEIDPEDEERATKVGAHGRWGVGERVRRVGQLCTTRRR